jgi:hypothetical protein
MTKPQSKFTTEANTRHYNLWHEIYGLAGKFQNILAAPPRMIRTSPSTIVLDRNSWLPTLVDNPSTFYQLAIAPKGDRGLELSSTSSCHLTPGAPWQVQYARTHSL